MNKPLAFTKSCFIRKIAYLAQNGVYIFEIVFDQEVFPQCLRREASITLSFTACGLSRLCGPGIKA